MNERIKQLVKQSQPKIDWEARHYGELNNGEKLDYQNQWFEKFAELIVRECIGCCEQVISDPVPKSVDTFEQGGIHCMDEIKQHFGVKE